MQGKCTGYVTRTREKKALKRYGRVETITTDGLRSYGAAMGELGNREKQEIDRPGRVASAHRMKTGLSCANCAERKDVSISRTEPADTTRLSQKTI